MDLYGDNFINLSPKAQLERFFEVLLGLCQENAAPSAVFRTIPIHCLINNMKKGAILSKKSPIFSPLKSHSFNKSVDRDSK